MADETLWDFAAIFGAETIQTESSFSVIVLNQPVRNVEIFLSLCSRASAIIAADGGANRIKDIHLNESRISKCMPRAIVGDLDSLRDDVRTYFVNKGVTVEEDRDQYSTDFTKCLKYIRSLQHDEESGRPSPSGDVVAFGGLGGRADQAFAQIHQLYTASQDESLVGGRIYIVTSESILFVLEKGRNRLLNMTSSSSFGENIGIIPVGEPATITTTGLEWDVEDWHTDFSTQVSTSNHIRSDIVTVETDTRILVSVELAVKPHP